MTTSRIEIWRKRTITMEIVLGSTPDPDSTAAPLLANLAINNAAVAPSSSSPDRIEIDKTPNGQQLAHTQANAAVTANGSSC
jgi:hypothetical protein